MDFSHLFVVKTVTMFVWKRPKINEKEAGVGPFFLKKKTSCFKDYLVPLVFSNENLK